MGVGAIWDSHGAIDSGSSAVVVVVGRSVVDVAGTVVRGTAIDVVASEVPDDGGAASGALELWQPVAAIRKTSAAAAPSWRAPIAAISLDVVPVAG